MGSYRPIEYVYCMQVLVGMCDLAKLAELPSCLANIWDWFVCVIWPSQLSCLANIWACMAKPALFLCLGHDNKLTNTDSQTGLAFIFQ